MVLLYVAAASPLGLGFATVVSGLDRSHQVQVSAGGQGFRLVLHHATSCANHRHGLVAKSLVLFSQPRTVANSDHVLQFSSADILKSRSGSTSQARQLDGQSFGPAASRLFSIAQPFFASAVSAHPTIGESGSLRCLRSTVLLI